MLIASVLPILYNELIRALSACNAMMDISAWHTLLIEKIVIKYGNEESADG